MTKYVSLEHAIRNAVRDQNYKKVNEDFEFEMARNELRTAIDAAKRLMAQLDGEGELEAWVQSKITKGADYLDTVADYMDSRDTKKLKEETQELIETMSIVNSKFKGNDFTTPVRIAPTVSKAAIKVSGHRRIQKQSDSATMQGRVVEAKKEEKEDGEDDTLLPKIKNKVNTTVDDVANTVSSYTPQAVKDVASYVSSPISSGIGAISDKIQSITKVNDDEVAKNLAQKKANFADLSPEQQKMVPASVQRALKTATPETTAERLKGASSLAAGATLPTLVATTASDAITNAKKGDYLNAAGDIAGAAAGIYGFNKLSKMAGSYLDKFGTKPTVAPTAATSPAPKPVTPESPKPAGLPSATEVPKPFKATEAPKPANDSVPPVKTEPPKAANQNIPAPEPKSTGTEGPKPQPVKEPQPKQPPYETGVTRPKEAPKPANDDLKAPEPKPKENIKPPKEDIKPPKEDIKPPEESMEYRAGQSRARREDLARRERARREGRQNRRNGLRDKIPLRVPKLPSFGADSEYKAPPPHSEYHDVPVKTSVSQAQAHRKFATNQLARFRAFREETGPDNTRRKDSSKELVGRPDSAGVKDPKSVLARNGSIKTKIIDEQNKLAGVVKSVVKKKKEEKESGPNPLVDFEPKLNHKYDNET